MGRRSAVASARRGSRGPVVAAVVTVLVLVGVIAAGVAWSHGSSTPAAGPGPASTPIPPTKVDASYPVALRAGVIELGRPTARHTVEVYEDALCPACQQFEATDGPKMAQGLGAGKIKVRYHMVNLLDRRSNPAGYSTLGGNAIMCAAEHGGFPSVHASLYDAQPDEGAAGYTASQLVGLGQAVGAGPGYADCVNRNVHGPEIAAGYAHAIGDASLRSPGDSPGSFSTPTIVLDRKKVDDPGALTAVLG